MIRIAWILQITISLIFLIAAFNTLFLIHLILPMNFETNWEFLLLNIKLLFLSKYNVEASMTILSSVKLDFLIIAESIPIIIKNFRNKFLIKLFFFNLIILIDKSEKLELNKV